MTEYGRRVHGAQTSVIDELDDSKLQQTVYIIGLSKGLRV